jgi:Protein kinase domain
VGELDPRPETLRNGRFVLLGPLGEGAQGVTFDGVDKREGRPVAIKRFDVRGARSWKDVELAEREARVLRSFSHPKLPAYVDHFEEDGALYLVMEKIDGESLAARQRRGAPFGRDEIVRLLRDASNVLDYLHGRTPPVIHRDLKPGNVIRRPDGSFAFVDFGAVRDKLRAKGGSTVVGTFGYMAPEQLQGRALPASDVYALGATALTMLTGREPEDLPHRGLAIDVRAALRGTRTDARLVGVLERMLEPDPDRRAPRIAPLLALLEPRAPAAVTEGSGRHASGRPDAHEAWRAERWARKAERRARRSARHAARAASHHAWANAYGSSTRGPPWPARLVFAILMTVGIVAVALATQVVVPLVLSVLSIFFARRALSNAVRSVRGAGHVAIDAMNASRRWVSGKASSARTPTARESPSEGRDNGAQNENENENAHEHAGVRVTDLRTRVGYERDEEDEETEEAADVPDDSSTRSYRR